MKINRGSEWRKWDLHTHTKGTNKNDQFTSSTTEEFFYYFFKKAFENEISGIGITDYFSIDNYLLATEYVKQIETKVDENGDKKFTIEEINFIKNIYLFPNVELRMLPCTGVEKLINIHCLFNPKYTNDLENDFFGSLENQDHFKMNRQGFISYGKSLKPQLTDDNSLYIEGLNNFAIDPKSLKTILDKNQKFRENTVTVVSNSNKDGNSGLQHHFDLFEGEEGSLDGVRKTIYKISNAIFSTNPKDIKYFLGKRLDDTSGITPLQKQEERKLVLQERGSYKPCIVGSDAHKEEDLFTRFTWIKTQPTFEGLKQIIYEPDERVRIQKEKPESEKLDNLIIEKVTFTSSNNKFTPEPIYFNKNLNVIIGGKSSGKSILLYEIAKTLYENQSDSVLKYKDSNNNKENDLYNLQEDDPQFNFIVETFLGTQQSIIRESNQASILPSIKYIPQNHLSNLVDKSKRNSNELKKYIRDLIREIPQYDKIYNDFIEKLKQNDKIRENDISEYFTYKEELVRKKGELQQKGDKETIKKSIEALEKKISETKKDLTPEQSTEYNSLSLENSELNKIKNSLINDLEKIKNFSDAVRYTLNELKAKKTLLLDNLELDNIKNDFTTKLNFIDDAILENDNIKKLITKDENENFQIIEGNIFSSEFKRINQSIKEVKEKLTPYNNLFENQKLILSYQNTISEEKIKLSDIEQIEKEIENITKTANERKSKIFDDIRNNRNLYDNLLTDFAPRIEKIKEEDSELKIEGKIHFNFPKYRESVLSISHGNSKSYLNYNIFNEKNEALIDYDFENYLIDLKAIFDSIENGTYSTLKDVTKQRAISLILEQKWFFDNWDITYKNDTIHKMSTGKASLVLLKVMIKLSAVKGPILIDQPEDNLDNRSVTNELISYLKNKKKERQIILVTHNANIVVNADAENIIIANQRGQSEEDKQGSPYLFDYINGAIEDIEPLSNKEDEKDLLKSLGVREHITQIVEGGKEAFKKREEKYGFK